jgi:Calpain family cysteine protease
MARNQNNQIAMFEMLESRTMMSAALPHVEATKAAAKAPVVKAPLKHVTPPVKTVDPAVTDNSISYKNFSSDPLFAGTGPTISDINQGYLGDCYLLSTLSSVAGSDPKLIEKDVVADGNGIYTVTFGTGKGTQVNVNADLPVWPDGQLAYAQLGNQNSLWVAIYEKAFAQYQNPKADSYATIVGGWMSEAFSALGLSSKTTIFESSSTQLITALQSDLKAGDFTTFGTVSTLPSDSPLIADHAYEVNSVQVDSKGKPVSITLRNPWGNGSANDGFVTITAQQAYSAFVGIVTAKA